MEEYQEMYYKLFNKVTNVIFEFEAAQRETEEMFITKQKGNEQKNAEE